MENNENIEIIDTPEQNQPVQSGKKMSITSLICGILGLVGDFIPYVSYVMFILSILAIVFGAKGKKQSVAAGEPTGMATAGLVLGIIGTAFGVLGVLCSLCALCGLGTLLGTAA